MKNKKRIIGFVGLMITIGIVFTVLKRNSTSEKSKQSNRAEDVPRVFSMNKGDLNGEGENQVLD